MIPAPLRFARPAPWRAAPRPADVAVTGRMGLYTIEPLTEDGLTWLRRNVNAEGWQWRRGILCLDDGAYFYPILHGMKRAGLRVVVQGERAAAAVEPRREAA